MWGRRQTGGVGSSVERAGGFDSGDRDVQRTVLRGEEGVADTADGGGGQELPVQILQ